MGVPPSPRRRKLRMLRQDDVPGDLVLVVRATPAAREAAIADIAADGRRSGLVYAVAVGDRREVLFGVSVFARRSGTPLAGVLARFDGAPTYLEAPLGALRDAGYTVLPTGANPDHFDVQLVAGVEEGSAEPVEQIEVAARRLVDAAGDLRPNPAYAGPPEGVPWDDNDAD